MKPLDMELQTSKAKVLLDACMLLILLCVHLIYKALLSVYVISYN